MNRWIKRGALALALLAGAGIGGWYAIGGREGLILLVASWRKPTPAPHREVAWQQGPQTPPAGRRPPNVVLILADDMGHNDISFYGGGVDASVPTPNIDSIGREGVSFSAGYAGNATCAPSRAALMTGRYPTRFGFEFTPTPIGFARVVGHGIGDGSHPSIYHADREAETPDVADMAVPSTEVTIAALLQKAGYHTLHLGKWHLGETDATRPDARGFDESLGFYAGASMFLKADDADVVNAKQDFDPIDRFLWAALPWGVRYNGSEMFEPKGYMTDYLTDEAVKAIHANRNRPFFVYLAYNAIHTPLQATREDFDALPGIPDHTRRVYAAMVRNLDRNVGRVLQALKDEGLDENTLVIFTSDNGGANYIGLDGLNAPYRGWKATFYEGGIRVPFFMRWAGVIQAGSTYDAPVSHFDVFATAAAAASAAIPSDRTIDGVNLLPFLAGTAAGRPHDILFWRSGPYRTVQKGRWKLQAMETPKVSYLYDLAADPSEKADVAAANPEVVAELTALLDAHDREQAKPIWPALFEGAINVDTPLGKPSKPGDVFIYWSN
ncbi:MAG: sulfatase-like hydrolase/transferase [Alphaproteobacteria bacterium]|nr:sulfatase-like hydrolase/transferase [Alphaproteobacteria bacterium]